MKLVATVVLAAFVWAPIVPAQIPVYHSQEEYCAANPSAVGCKDGKPVNVMEEMQKNWQTMQPSCDDHSSPMCGNNTPAAPRRPARQEPVMQALPASSQQPSRSLRSAALVRAGEVDWRLVQPQPDLVMGINVADLLASDFARDVIAQCLESSGANSEETQQMLANLAETSQIVVSIRQKQMLIALTGRLRGFPKGANVGPFQSMRVSSDTVVFGTPIAISGVSRRLNAGAAPSASLADARQLASASQLWMWGKPSALASFNPVAAADSSVTKIRFGASLRDAFRMDIVLDTPDSATAKAMLERTRAGAPPELRAAVEGSSVHYTLALDAATVRSRITELAANGGTKQLEPVLAAARQLAARRSAPMASGKIVIQGLDDGPREIPLSSAQQER